MDLYTDRPATPAEDWAEETRNIEVPGMLGRDGRPAVVTIRRLPAAEVYLLQGTTDKGEMRDIFRRWAQAAVVAPTFAFNGDGGPGVQWDLLPFAAHEGLASKIAAYSLQSSATAEAVEGAFRGGEPAGGDVGGAGGGPGGAGPDAPGEPPAPATGPEPGPAGGA